MRGYYKHERSMDLVMEVLKTQYRDEKRIKVKVRWWNLGWTGNAWTFGQEKLEIQVSDLKNWKPCNLLRE